jgi:hypothetical protein
LEQWAYKIGFLPQKKKKKKSWEVPSILATLEIGYLVSRWGGDTYILDFHLDNLFGARGKPHNE